MNLSYRFTFPLYLQNAIGTPVEWQLEAILSDIINIQAIPIAATLVTDGVKTDLSKFDNLQYHVKCARCKLLLILSSTDAASEQKQFKTEITDLSIQIASDAPQTAASPIPATLLRGSIVIPITASQDKLIFSECWPFSQERMTAIRLEPSGIHIQGQVPTALANLWENKSIPKELALRCPQHEYDSVRRRIPGVPDGNPTDCSYWTLARIPLRYADTSLTLSAEDFISATEQTFSAFENKSWLDNVRSNPSDRTHVRFYRGNYNGQQSVHWEALHSATRITIAAGTGAGRSAESHFLPDAIAGVLSADGNQMLEPVSYTLFQKSSESPDSSRRERRFVEFVKNANATLSITSERYNKSITNEPKLAPLSLECLEAPLQRRSAELNEQSELWCCTDDGWLSWQGKRLIKETVDFGREYGLVGLSGPVDLFPLIQGIMFQDDADAAADDDDDDKPSPDFPAESMLLLNSSESTRIICTLEKDKARLVIDKPICLFKTPRVFLAEPLPQQFVGKPLDSLSNDDSGKPEDEEVPGADDGTQTSPLAIPTIRSTASSGSPRGDSILQEFTSATFISSSSGGNKEEQATKDLPLRATLKVDLKKRTLHLKTVSRSDPAGIGDPQATHWAEPSLPIARTYPDPQSYRNRRAGVKTADGKPIRFLDENRGLHPSHWHRQGDSEDGPELVFIGGHLPQVQEPFRYPTFQNSWKPDVRFVKMRSFLTTLPGIEYEYPETFRDVSWGYRYANPAMDEAYAMVVEDTDRVASDYLFDLNGPDTTRVIHAVAFLNNDQKAKFLIPISTDDELGSVPLQTPSLSTENNGTPNNGTPSFPKLTGTLGIKELLLSRPTQGKVDADILPALEVIAEWNPNQNDPPVVARISTRFDSTTPNLVGHGQPLLSHVATISNEPIMVVQDALGTTLSQSLTKQKTIESSTWHTQPDGNVDLRRKVTETRELKISDNSSWKLELVGISYGSYDTLFFASSNGRPNSNIELERWSLHDGQFNETKLWGFPFVPTQLQELRENTAVIKGILCPYVERKPEETNGNHRLDRISLSGQEELLLTFEAKEKTYQLTNITGKIDWRFASSAEQHASGSAELVRLFATVTGDASLPQFKLDELACNTPVGLVRMLNPKNGSCVLDQPPTDQIPKSLLVNVTDWTPWSEEPVPKNKPTTKHSVGPFLIYPDDKFPQIQPYDFQWVTPGGTDREVLSTVAFGSTPEYREKAFVDINSELVTALSRLTKSDLTLLSGLDDQKGDLSFSQAVRNFVLASSENKRRRLFYGDQILNKINNWLTTADVRTVNKLVEAQGNSPVSIVLKEPPHIILANTHAKAEVEISDENISDIFFANDLVDYRSDSPSGPNPLLQGWHFTSEPQGGSIEHFDQFVQKIEEGKSPNQFCSSSKDGSQSWHMTHLPNQSYSFGTGTPPTAATKWIATVKIQLPADYKNGFSCTLSANQKTYTLTFTNENNAILCKVKNNQPEVKITAPPTGYVDLKLNINYSNSIVSVTVNNLSLSDVQGEAINANTLSHAVTLTMNSGTTGTTPIRLNACHFFVETSAPTTDSHPDIALKKVDNKYFLQISNNVINPDSKGSNQLPVQFTPLRVCFVNNDPNSETSVQLVDLSVVRVSDAAVALTRHFSGLTNLPFHTKQWLLRHLFQAVLAARGYSTDVPISWEHAWHSTVTITSGKEIRREPAKDKEDTSLLGDVVMKPIQISADRALFEITNQAYFEPESREKLNSHLRTRPTGGFYGVEVHWQYKDKNEDEDENEEDGAKRSFLHFQKPAFELQLHLTDRRQRDAVAIWTPPDDDDTMDELHIKEDSVGEIQAFDGFSPEYNDSPHPLQVFWIGRSGSLKTWQPFWHNRLTDKGIPLGDSLPLIELVVARSRKLSDNSKLLLVDDLGTPFEVTANQTLEKFTTPHPLQQALIFSATEGSINPMDIKHQDSKFLASDIPYNDDPAIAILRSKGKSEVIEVQVDQIFARQYICKHPVNLADFLKHNRKLLWQEGTALKAWETEEQNRGPINLFNNALLSAFCVIGDEKLLLFLRTQNTKNIIGREIPGAAIIDNNLSQHAFQAFFDKSKDIPTSLTELQQCISLGKSVAANTSLGLLCGRVITNEKMNDSFQFRPLVISNLQVKETRRLKKENGPGTDGHLIAFGEGSQTNCIGILSYSSGKEGDKENKLSLQLTGKIVLQNDIVIEESLWINNKEDFAECSHRVDLFVDRAEVPVEMLFSGPKEDTVIAAVAQHVFRFPRGKEKDTALRLPKELRWQCAQSVRFSTAGRLRGFLGGQDIKEDDNRLVVDASSVVLLKPFAKSTPQALNGGHTSEGGGGILRNQLVETTLQPVRPTDFNTMGNDNQSVPVLVRLPMLASPSFKPRDQSETPSDGVPSPLERPRLRLDMTSSIDNPTTRDVGSQFLVLSPSPHIPRPHGEEATTAIIAQNDRSDDQRIDFVFRNSQAAWLDSGFLGYTLAPEKPDRHDQHEWPGTKTNDIRPLTPVMSADINKIWPTVNQDGGASFVTWRDLAPLRLHHDGPVPSESGRYQGNRVICAAASLTRKSVPNHGGNASGPCLFEFPFYVNTNRFSEEASAEARLDDPSAESPKIEMQLVVYENGRFRRLAHDLLSIDQKDQQLQSKSTRNDAIIQWGRHELNRRRRLSSAFVIVDFRETLLIPPHPSCSESDLNDIPDFHDTHQNESWPIPPSALMSHWRDPRFVHPQKTAGLTAQIEETLFAYAAEPSGKFLKRPTPVSSTIWRLTVCNSESANTGFIPAAKTFSFYEAKPKAEINPPAAAPAAPPAPAPSPTPAPAPAPAPAAPNPAHDEGENKDNAVEQPDTGTVTIPVITWRESIPFEVTSLSGEFPRPHLNGSTAMAGFSVAEVDSVSPQDLRQMVRPPRLDLNAWSARPGEMTTNSWMTAQLESSKTADVVTVKMTAINDLTLRRARAVASKNELVALTKDSDSTLPEPLKQRFRSAELTLKQQIARSTLEDGVLLMALTTSTEVHFGYSGDNGKEDAKARPIMLKGGEGESTEAVHFHFFSKEALIVGKEKIVLLKTDEAPDTFDNLSLLNNNSIGELIAKPLNANEPVQYELKKNDNLVPFVAADSPYVVAKYTLESDNFSYKLDKKFSCWLSIKLISEASRFRPPSLAVAVIAQERRLVGYGHLENEDFSLISPTFENTSTVSWQRRARLNVLHRHQQIDSSNNRNDIKYDIVVTGPSGQTYPTVETFE